MPSQKQLQKEVDNFNKKFKVGDVIRYYEILNGAKFEVYKIKSEAFILSGHTACVFLENKSGCVACSHCKPIL
ncbi:MAG: hypothetical protein LBC20_14230 [Planctomycetaceae bacterium]|jgi:hypothetical protein|nr:hypothetical protein [Planctomycetaceae bacterium]